MAAVHFEEAGVGAGGRERLGGRLVEGDRLDAMWWLGLDVEVEGRWFAGAGADEGDGRFGAGVEGEAFELDAAAFGDGLVEEGDHGVGGEDVAEELGADVFVDLVDGEGLCVRCEVVEGPAQLLADGGVGDLGRRVGDRGRGVSSCGVVAGGVVVAARREGDDGEGDEGGRRRVPGSDGGDGHEVGAFQVTSRWAMRRAPAAMSAAA